MPQDHRGKCPGVKLASACNSVRLMILCTAGPGELRSGVGRLQDRDCGIGPGRPQRRRARGPARAAARPARKDRPSLRHDLQISEGQACHGDPEPARAALGFRVRRRQAREDPRRLGHAGSRAEAQRPPQGRGQKDRGDEREFHPHPHGRRHHHRRTCDPRHRHAGQSQPDALRGRRSAAHPVSARRSGGICRRAYHGDRLGRCRHRECARPRRRSGAGQCRLDHEPECGIRPRQAGECRPADGGGEERPGEHPVRDDAGEGRAGFSPHGDPRRRAEDQVRPDHRPHGLLAAAQVRRGMRDRVHQRRQGFLSCALPAIRDDGAGHLRHRRAGRLSADQALHEPGLRRRSNSSMAMSS